MALAIAVVVVVVAVVVVVVAAVAATSSDLAVSLSHHLLPGPPDVGPGGDCLRDLLGALADILPRGHHTPSCQSVTNTTTIDTSYIFLSRWCQVSATFVRNLPHFLKLIRHIFAAGSTSTSCSLCSIG